MPRLHPVSNAQDSAWRCVTRFRARWSDSFLTRMADFELETVVDINTVRP